MALHRSVARTGGCCATHASSGAPGQLDMRSYHLRMYPSAWPSSSTRSSGSRSPLAPLSAAHKYCMSSRRSWVRRAAAPFAVTSVTVACIARYTSVRVLATSMCLCKNREKAVHSDSIVSAVRALAAHATPLALHDKRGIPVPARPDTSVEYLGTHDVRRRRHHQQHLCANPV